MDYKYHGIILSKNDIAETDRIYNIYTLESGKIRALGKGTRNPNAKLAGSLEPATYSEIYVSRTRGMGKITGAIVSDNFSVLKSDFESLAEIFRVFGIVEKIITNEEKDEAVFELLLEYLKILEKIVLKGEKEKIGIVTLGFIFKLLDFSGYGMNTDNCARCNKKLLPEDNFFSARSGGFFCPKCATNGERRIGTKSAAIKLIRIFLSNKISNFGKISASAEIIKNSKNVADEMMRWIAG